MTEGTVCERRKILYVFGGEKASGAEIVIERLMLHNLASVEPHLFISSGEFAEQLLQSGRPYRVTLVERLRKLNRSSTGKAAFFLQAIKNNLAISWLVMKYTRKNKIGVIHANTIVPATYLLPAIVFTRLSGGKKYWFWSDHDLSYFSKLDTVFSKTCLACYTKTLAVSGAVKQKYGDQESVEILYNGLDTDVFKFDAEKRSVFRHKLSFSDNCTVFGIAATISPRKGQLEAMEAFSELSRSHPNIRLVLAGKFADDTQHYNAEVQKALQEEPSVDYLGQVDNMVNFYNGCDVIINNSSKIGSEPLGTTLYEAMACGKVVIASRTGGTEEIIDDNINGFLFEPNSKEDLKATIEKILESDKLNVVTKAARKKAVEKFNINKMMSSYNQIINNVVSK